MTDSEMHDYYRVKTFYTPGVNPQCMDPAVSGDSFGMMRVGDADLITLADGAWVKGYDADPAVGDIASLSSRTVVDVLEAAFACNPLCGFRALLAAAIPTYRATMDALRGRMGYEVVVPEDFRGLDVAKVGPQSAFVALRFSPNGSVEIAQVRDCLAVAEYADGRMVRLTPNQSELVAAATKSLPVQHEGLGAYQALAKDIILGGRWREERAKIRRAAELAHRADFFRLWVVMDEGLPHELAGEEGFALWRDTFDTLCLCQNSAYFLNNPATPWRMADGTPLSWAMFTGEESMLDLTFFRTLVPKEMKDMVAIWLMSDGAFKQGDRGSDLNAMRELGPERYYTEVLMRRFDGSTPGRRRYHDARVPMDVTILRVPLPLR